MTNQEAQFILDGYRPGGRDAGEPMFAAALQQAQQDPTLREWFAREQKHASAIAAKLLEIAPPPGLRGDILAGAKVSKSPASAAWPRSRWLAVAASLAVLLAVGAVWRWSTQAPLARLEAFVSDDALHGTHGVRGAAAEALVATLSKSTTRMGGALPIDFATLRLSGCRTLSFAGRDLLEVCFRREGIEYHLYVTRLEDFPGVRGAAEPQFSERDGIALASWADTAFRYVLVTKRGVAALQQLM